MGAAEQKATMSRQWSPSSVSTQSVSLLLRKYLLTNHPVVRPCLLAHETPPTAYVLVISLGSSRSHPGLAGAFALLFRSAAAREDDGTLLRPRSGDTCMGVPPSKKTRKTEGYCSLERTKISQ